MKIKRLLFCVVLLFSLTSFAQAQMRNENAKIVVSAGVSLRVSGALDQRQGAGLTNSGTVFISGGLSQRQTSTFQTQATGKSTLQGSVTLLNTSSFQNAGSTEVLGNVLHQGSGSSSQNTGFLTVQGSFEMRTGTSSLNNGNLFVSVNWTNDASATAFSGTGKVQFYGLAFASIGGNFNTNFYDLEINRMFLTATKNVFIANNLNFISGTAFFQTAGVLFATATITNEANKRYATGILVTTRNINASETFGGLGVTLNPLGQNLGQITLVREAGTGVSELHLERNSINRTWTFITTSSNLFSTVFATVNLAFSWLSDDDNGVNLSDTHIWHKPPQKKGNWIGMTLPVDNSFRTASNVSTYSFDYVNKIQSNSLTKYTVGGVGNVKISGTITEIGFGLPFVSVLASNGNFSMTDGDGFYSVTQRAGFQGSIIPSKKDAVGENYFFTSAGLNFISVFEDINAQNFTAIGRYFVKGKVIEIDRPVKDAKVSINHSSFFTTVTNDKGEYTAFVSSGFEGNISVEKEPYFVSASPRPIINKLSHQYLVDFYASRTYLVTGRVTEAGESLAGVFITTNIGFTTVTNDQGIYLAFVSSGYNGKITASKPDYTFVPPDYSYTKVLEPQEDKDHKAHRTYLIMGKVTESGQPLSNVNITLSNNFTTVSDRNGFYTAFVTSGFEGKIQSSKVGYVFFEPSKIDLPKILKNKPDVDFDAKALYGIQGKVVKDGLGFASVNITSKHGDIFQTDQNGFYTAFVSSGYTGTLVASKTGHFFQPPSLSFNSVIGFQSVPNFVAFGLQAITGKIVLDGKPLAGVKVITSAGDIFETNENGFYTAFVSANGSTTLTFNKEHHEFDPKIIDFTSVTGSTSVNVALKAKLVQYAILGQILLNKSTPLANVNIKSAAFTTVTNQNGFYTVFQKAGFKGIIVPDSTKDYFDPPFISVESVFATISKIDFGAKTAEIDLKTEGIGVQKDGKTVYCSNVEMSVDLAKYSAEAQGKTTYLWADRSTKPILTAKETGLYFVTVKVPKFYPTGISKTVDLEINRLVVKWGKDSTICIGSRIGLESDPKAATRRWQQKNGSNYTDLANSTAANQTLGEGIYRLQMTNGTCDVSYEIAIKHAPEQKFTSVQTLYYFCNDSEPVKVSGKNEHSVKYAWTGAGFQSDKAEVEIVKGGTYKLVATDKYDCTKETTFEVNDTERLENIFLFQDQVRVGDTVVFINVSRPKAESKTDPAKAEWDFGIAKSSNLEYVEQIFTEEGDHKITLTVSNAQCETKRSKTLKVSKMPQGGRAEKVFPQALLEQMSLAAYPSPARNYVKVKLQDMVLKSVNLSVFDSYGRKLFDKEVETAQEQTLDCSQWSTGVYLIRITSGKVVKSLRFVKE